MYNVHVYSKSGFINHLIIKCTCTCVRATSMVTTAVVAVALKMKPKLKEASTTRGCQAVHPKASHQCVHVHDMCSHTPGHPSVHVANDAWYRPKCILHIG